MIFFLFDTIKWGIRYQEMSTFGIKWHVSSTSEIIELSSVNSLSGLHKYEM